MRFVIELLVYSSVTWGYLASIVCSIVHICVKIKQTTSLEIQVSCYYNHQLNRVNKCKTFFLTRRRVLHESINCLFVKQLSVLVKEFIKYFNQLTSWRSSQKAWMIFVSSSCSCIVCSVGVNILTSPTAVFRTSVELASNFLYNDNNTINNQYRSI